MPCCGGSPAGVCGIHPNRRSGRPGTWKARAKNVAGIGGRAGSTRTRARGSRNPRRIVGRTGLPPPLRHPRFGLRGENPAGIQQGAPTEPASHLPKASGRGPATVSARAGHPGTGPHRAPTRRAHGATSPAVISPPVARRPPPGSRTTDPGAPNRAAGSRGPIAAHTPGTGPGNRSRSARLRSDASPLVRRSRARTGSLRTRAAPSRRRRRPRSSRLSSSPSRQTGDNYVPTCGI